MGKSITTEASVSNFHLKLLAASEQDSSVIKVRIINFTGSQFSIAVAMFFLFLLSLQQKLSL